LPTSDRVSSASRGSKTAPGLAFKVKYILHPFLFCLLVLSFKCKWSKQACKMSVQIHEVLRFVPTGLWKRADSVVRQVSSTHTHLMHACCVCMLSMCAQCSALSAQCSVWAHSVWAHSVQAYLSVIVLTVVLRLCLVYLMCFACVLCVQLSKPGHVVKDSNRDILYSVRVYAPVGLVRGV
jgi:hypothetical protein